jgi:thiol-disulfide isomerase/thioredoxin
MKYLFILTCTMLSVAAKAQGDRTYIGQQLPRFAIVTKTGFITHDSLKGKVSLINFFATWCPPCIEELPVLQKEVWEKYKDNKKFRLFVVGRDHTEAEMDSFKKRKGYTLPFYADKSQGVFAQFASKYIPRNYVINQEGQIVYSSTVYTREEFDKLLNMLRELLQE